MAPTNSAVQMPAPRGARRDESSLSDFAGPQCFHGLNTDLKEGLVVTGTSIRRDGHLFSLWSLSGTSIRRRGHFDSSRQALLWITSNVATGTFETCGAFQAPRFVATGTSIRRDGHLDSSRRAPRFVATGTKIAVTY
jgi:hypothetical protein